MDQTQDPNAAPTQLTAEQQAVLDAAQVQQPAEQAPAAEVVVTTDVAALTTGQAQAITTADLVALSTSQAQAITTADVAALTTSEAPALTTTELPALAAAQAPAVAVEEVIYKEPAPQGPYHLIDTEHGKINEIASHLGKLKDEAIAAIEAISTEFSHFEVVEYKNELLAWLSRQ